MEFMNTPVKALIGSGNNLKAMNRIQNEIKLQIGGDVRNFIKSV